MKRWRESDHGSRPGSWAAPASVGRCVVLAWRLYLQHACWAVEGKALFPGTGSLHPHDQSGNCDSVAKALGPSVPLAAGHGRPICQTFRRAGPARFDSFTQASFRRGRFPWGDPSDAPDGPGRLQRADFSGACCAGCALEACSNFS